MIVAASLLVACTAPATVTQTPSLTATVPIVTLAPTPTASATARPSPTADPVALPGIRAAPAGALPESFRYVALDIPWAEGFRTRLWLVDLDARRAPKVVAEWDGPASPVGEHSIAADGRTILISAKGARSRVALYVLRVESGTVTTVFEQPGTIVISPRLSPDGQRFAFTQLADGASADDGIWSGILGGETKRLVERTTTVAPLMSLGWSIDSIWLAYARIRERTEVFLAHREGGPEIAVGEGDRLSWRASSPQLLVAANGSPSSRIYTFDLATRKAVEVAKVDRKTYPLVQWHPQLERFVYVEASGGGASIGGEIWLRSADGSGASSVDLGRSVSAPQWSRDGILLTALVGGDDSVVPLIDLFSGRRIAILCRRGGTPPGDCA